jgi:hypothetical protein
MQYVQPDPDYVPTNKVEERVQWVSLHAGVLEPPLQFGTFVSSTGVFDAPIGMIANATIKSTVAALACGTAAFFAIGGMAPIVVGCALAGSMIAGVEGAFEVKKMIGEEEKKNPPPPFTEEDRQRTLKETAEKMHGMSPREIEKIIRPADKEKNKIADIAHTVFVGAAAPITTLALTAGMSTLMAASFVMEKTGLNTMFSSRSAKMSQEGEQMLAAPELETLSPSIQKKMDSGLVTEKKQENPAKKNANVQLIIASKDNESGVQKEERIMAR